MFSIGGYGLGVVLRVGVILQMGYVQGSYVSRAYLLGDLPHLEVLKEMFVCAP